VRTLLHVSPEGFGTDGLLLVINAVPAGSSYPYPVLCRAS
jgi:hypothetical protein